MENIIWRIVIAVVAVWLILSIFLPFVYGYVSFPDIIKTLLALATVFGAIWYVLKGSLPFGG